MNRWFEECFRRMSRLRESRSNETPWIWHQGQMKERAGFIVSRSLTLSISLSSVHVVLRVGGRRHSEDFPRWTKNKDVSFGLAVSVIDFGRRICYLNFAVQSPYLYLVIK